VITNISKNKNKLEIIKIGLKKTFTKNKKKRLKTQKLGHFF